MLSQTFNNSINEGSLTLRDGVRRGTTVMSSALTLDSVPKAPKEKLRVESIQKFDGNKKMNAPVGVQKIIESSDESKSKVAIMENLKSKGRFRRRTVVDNRNDLIKEHEKNMNAAKSILCIANK